MKRRGRELDREERGVQAWNGIELLRTGPLLVSHRVDGQEVNPLDNDLGFKNPRRREGKISQTPSCLVQIGRAHV